MTSFKDTEGRQWMVRIDVDAVKRVRALVDVDLLDAAGGDLLPRIAADPVLLCDVLFALCQPEAEKRGVTDDQFGSAMGGDTIDDAAEAFMEALVDFFPKRRRAVLTKARTKLAAFEEIAMNAAAARLDDPALEAELRAQIEAAMRHEATEGDGGTRATEGGGGGGSSSPSSPASSGSTPDR